MKRRFSPAIASFLTCGQPVNARALGTSLGLTLLLMVTCLPACGKKTEPPVAKPSAQAPAATAEMPAGATGTAGAVAPGEAVSPTEAASPTNAGPAPELGIPLDAYVQARTLENCALRFHEDPIRAETVAVQQILGKPFPKDLERVFDPPGKAKAKVKTAMDTAEELAMRTKYRAAHALASGHGPTVAQVDSNVKSCLYAAEMGMISQDLIDRYIKTFVEIACLQRQHMGADGQVDATAHAQAAAGVFTANQFNAGEFSRIGMVLGRFADVQSKLHAAKAKVCPDPRMVAAEKATTGEWNGGLQGERNGSLHLSGATGAVKGAVQWLGATVKYADGGSETQAIPVEGQISGDKVSLFGQIGNDWVRLEGTLATDKLSGTWTAQRAGTDKFKGTWKGEKIPAAKGAK